jgi:peptide deformylase
VSEEVKRGPSVSAFARRIGTDNLRARGGGAARVAIQHEHDHLEGVLMIDQLGVLKKKIVQRKMQKAAR